MAWVRIEDAVTEHRKHLKAGPSACWLWVCGIAYCQRQLSDGFIPNEALPMIGVLGVNRCQKLADVLVNVGLFDRAEGGYRVHDYHDYNETKVEAQQRRTELSAKRSRAGRMGGLKSGEARHATVEANTQANVKQPLEAERSPIPSHPIPSQKEQERTNALESAAIPKRANGNGAYSPEVGERAGRLVERYGELFLQHRAGAKYRQRPNLDWHDAMTLVPVWDDTRLEKLAVLVLTTDDPWISSTDRGFKIFAMKASWADDRLRAWEQEHQVQA